MNRSQSTVPLLLLLLACGESDLHAPEALRSHLDTAASIGLISQRSWDEPECVAWNSWDGNRFDGNLLDMAYWSDGAQHSLCGAGDGWRGYGRAFIDGLYGAELVMHDPAC